MKLRRIVSVLLLIIVIALSIGAAYYFIQSEDALFYRDAKSHVNIARRVLFSKTPGLAQLGGVWLPLPHVVMLPMIWHDPLYYSGLAGIIPSMIAFVCFVYFLYSLLVLVTKSRTAGIVGSLVLVTNPSLLYLQSTPMTEVLVLATITGSIYFLAQWIYTGKFTFLVGSALCVFLATLARYDGWFVFVCASAVVMLVSLISPATRKKADGITCMYMFLGGFGIALWLIYSKLIFGNFLNFAVGKGTGSWDAARVSGTGLISSKYDMVHSFLTFSWMSIDNAGIVLFCLGVFGFLWYSIRNVRNIPVYLVVLLLSTPYIFNIISLFLGLSVAYSEHIAPFQSYNLRYGTAVLPFTAFFVGYMARGSYILRCVVVLLICIQCYLFYTKPLDILADARVGNVPAEIVVAHWIRDHPIQGDTLMSTLSHDPLLFESRLSMQRVVYEGNQYLWDAALIYPEAHVHRVVFKKSDTVNDEVRNKLYGSKSLEEHFENVYDDGDYQVYDRTAPTP